MRETCYRGRLLRDEQRSPDLAVRPALREDGQHLDLAGAQAKTREFVLCRVRCRSRRRVGLLPLHWLVERGASPGSQGTDQLDQRLRAYPGGGVMGTAQRRGSFRSDGDTNGTRGLSEQGLRQPEAKMYRPHSIPPASATSTTARQAARSGRSCIRDISEAPGHTDTTPWVGILVRGHEQHRAACRAHEGSRQIERTAVGQVSLDSAHRPGAFRPVSEPVATGDSRHSRSRPATWERSVLGRWRASGLATTWGPRTRPAGSRCS